MQTALLALRRTALLSVQVCSLSLAVAWTRPVAASDAPTFTRDVLPVLQAHCQACHRPGQIGPMSLLTYEETRPWAKAIQKETAARSMPPFHAEGPVGRFQNDLRLSEADLATIQKWVDQGAVRGNPADAPASLTWDDGRWHRPAPDLILKFPATRFDSTGIDRFGIVRSEFIFPFDTWVSAIEFMPAADEPIHHAGVFSLNMNEVQGNGEWKDNEVEDAADLVKRGTFLFTWLPGRGAYVCQEGQGTLVKADSVVVAQIHVGPNEESFTARPTVGIWLVDGLLKYETYNLAVISPEIVIPPKDPNYEFRAKQTVHQDTTVQAFNVHMHLRGKSSEVWFHYPDGRHECAFHIPHFDFNWQRQYFLATPQTIPQGTEIEYVAIWDNSEQNPHNPDPTATVRWGRRATDEMFSTTIQCRRELNKPLHVKRGRALGIDSAKN